MGIGKWLLKHGPGSPGATAKAIIKDYLKWKEKIPNYSQDELLYLILSKRLHNEAMVARIPPPSESSIQNLIREWQGDIRKLIFYIFERETPDKDKILLSNPQTLSDILDVIGDVFREFNTGGRLNGRSALAGKERGSSIQQIQTQRKEKITSVENKEEKKRKQIQEILSVPEDIFRERTKNAIKSLEPAVLREERAERIVQKCKERKYRENLIGFSVSESKKDEEIERITHPKNEKKETSKKRTILVVDDEIGPRESLRKILTPLYGVDTASDSEEALRLLANKDFDLVTTDLKRPGLSGIDFLKEIKRIWPNKAVIIISAFVTLANAKEAIKCGASDFISKPFGAQEVLSSVEKIFQGQQN